MENGKKTEFEFNISYVAEFIKGDIYDMGCGCQPLPYPNCFHFDISPQPITVDLVGDRFFQMDCTSNRIMPGVDTIFSSHMVEDLPTSQAIIDCLNGWGTLLNEGGHLVLLLPDMQGGRYPTVEEGGNESHRVNVGKDFILTILPSLINLELIQLNTIPHDKSCTIDVVFKKV